MFEAKVIKDSISEAGKRIVTVTVTYPRIIHAELMTHRAFSRNAGSSRAIPWKKTLTMVQDDPFIPIYWGMEQKGMQAGGQIPEKMRKLAESIWIKAMKEVISLSDAIANIGRTFVEENYNNPENVEEGDSEIRVHKSIPNRMLEPWSWITVVITSTEWRNFFRLRDHTDAEIHFQKMAKMLKAAIAESEPIELGVGEWHLPFVLDDDWNEAIEKFPREPGEGPWKRLGRITEFLRKVSVARCARVSYLTHDGKRDFDSDMSTWDKLVGGSGFGHWSPHEHVAKALADSKIRSGNFVGWEQFRKGFPQENLEG